MLKKAVVDEQANSASLKVKKDKSQSPTVHLCINFLPAQIFILSDTTFCHTFNNEDPYAEKWHEPCVKEASDSQGILMFAAPLFHF